MEEQNREPEAATTSRSFDREALLAAAVAAVGGRERSGQQRMAQAVATALETEQHLLVQAGTGTGKSLGYLVPVVADAVTSGRRAVVSTATLALQRQILSHDAPIVAGVVREHTGAVPDIALLKGWSNYLCKHKLAGGFPAGSEDPGTEPGLFDAPGGGPADRPTPEPSGSSSLGEQVLRLRSWAEETDSGDRDDLTPGVSERAWRQVSVSKLECLGQACPMLAECFPEAARQRAHQADVVITNHAMLGIASTGNTPVLPEHDVLVVDEAHELVDRVTAQTTGELSVGVVERTLRLARTHLAGSPQATERVDQGVRALRARLEATADGRMRQGMPEALTEAVSLLEAAVREALSAMAPEAGAAQEAKGALATAKAAMTALHEVTERLLHATDGAGERTEEGRGKAVEVIWCERPREGVEPPRLKVAPLDVASPIATHLLEGRTGIFTSATLALGGVFEPMARSMGVSFAEAGWQGVDAGSPFDYPRQGILYVARHLPQPGRDGPSDESLRELVQLVRASGGGALGLFSSRRGAERAAERLRTELETPVLCQGDDQLPTLVRDFSADESATLVGTLSLWQGVDVPGRTCRLVIIDRIPFPRPDDPVRSARTEAVAASGGNGFMAVAAHHAALLLAQGAGRLIRRLDDRGVVAVLDPRLATARYGGFLTRSMPPLWRTTDTELTLRALERLRG
ncbi:ATP-dependent DNA helicase [Bogoriella caseilytica]|uniref:DNA 5'-3' helicase n=1 Tax=Bogoriella caseilytica TaxID=56055 RepID=A0A3N2B9D0_9MICO|nr:ATP-dependent DNA helicase [Bogoriella caseilytica]ROR71860.1 ATP-dependent DNA helicase DinG [Bogoriella caseilytica]